MENLFRGINAMPVHHKGEKRLRLKFGYDPVLLEKIRNIKGCRWSASMHSWHVPDNDENRRLFGLGINDHKEGGQEPVRKIRDRLATAPSSEKEDTATASPIRAELESFERYMVSRRLSESTIRSYYEAAQRFLNYYKGKKASEITNEEVNDYLHSLVEKGFSSSMQNITISGIKMFYSKIINRDLDIDKIERPKPSRPLPKVISREDVEAMLSGISNYKHQMALWIIYTLGLRRGELLNLKLEDIDSKQMTISIRNAKGKKDRTLPMSENQLKRLRKYFKIYRPRVYLFEGTKAGSPYSPASLAKIFHLHMNRVRPGNTFTLHCLRHSCATHLLESGTDIRYIQEILGHKSTRTTEIYTHVSVRSLRAIKPPGDDFDI